MSLKNSMLENKDHILESLPTQELKDEFLANLEKMDDTIAKPSVDEQVKEAQTPDHVSEDLYDGVKSNIQEMQSTSANMSKEEAKAAIQEALKNPPKPEPGAEEE